MVLIGAILDTIKQVFFLILNSLSATAREGWGNSEKIRIFGTVCRPGGQGGQRGQGDPEGQGGQGGQGDPGGQRGLGGLGDPERNVGCLKPPDTLDSLDT